MTPIEGMMEGALVRKLKEKCVCLMWERASGDEMQRKEGMMKVHFGQETKGKVCLSGCGREE